MSLQTESTIPKSEKKQTRPLTINILCCEFVKVLKYISKSCRNAKRDGKSCEMNSLIVCHVAFEWNEKPNLMWKQRKKSRVIASRWFCVVQSGWRSGVWIKNLATVYTIVNLICTKTRKLNFKLNYFQTIFTVHESKKKVSAAMCLSFELQFSFGQFKWKHKRAIESWALRCGSWKRLYSVYTWAFSKQTLEM